MPKDLSTSRRPFASRIPAAAACSADQMTEIATRGSLLATRKWPPEPFQPEFNLDSTWIQPKFNPPGARFWSQICGPAILKKRAGTAARAPFGPSWRFTGRPKPSWAVSLRFHSGFTQVSRPSPSLCAIRPCQEMPAACFCGAKQKLRRQFGWLFGRHPVEFMPSRRCSTPISEAALRRRACRELR